MILDRFRLDGRVAVVTGGGGGIGAATARAFAEAGARVVIADRSAEAIERGSAALAAAGHDVAAVRFDVTRPEEVAAAAAALEERFGAVDVVFANAGIGLPDAPAESMGADDWRRMVDVNLHGVFWTCQAFGRAMLARGRGSIVTTGSMSGLVVNRPQRQAHYNASKAAVHQLTRSLAAEWAPRGVRVNAVAPGYVRTPMTEAALDVPELAEAWIGNTPMGRVGEPEEVAALVLFLASDAARLLTAAVTAVASGAAASGAPSACGGS